MLPKGRTLKLPATLPFHVPQNNAKLFFTRHIVRLVRYCTHKRFVSLLHCNADYPDNLSFHLWGVVYKDSLAIRSKCIFKYSSRNLCEILGA